MEEWQVDVSPKSGMLRIGRLAKETGIKVVTIRYYESLGLIPDPRQQQDTSKRNRKYSPSYVGRLLFIKEMRKFGYSLGEIKELVKLWEKRRQISKGRLAKKVYASMEKIQKRVDSLRAFRREIYKLLTQR